MVTPSSFKIRFPEFTTTSNDTIQMLIDEATLLITNFGTYQDIATNYLTAHLLTLNGKSSPSNSIASKTVGSVSISYGGSNGTLTESFYSSTSYGQMYLDLRKRISKGNVKLI
jgi:hypothetical protein